MDFIITIVVCIAVGVIYYFGKQYIDWQKLTPIVAEIVNLILRVENERQACKENVEGGEDSLVPLSGEEKKREVVKLIEKELDPEDIVRIRRSPFKTIARFVEYIFVNIAQPIILGRLANRKR